MDNQQAIRPDLDHKSWTVPLSRTEPYQKHGHLMRAGASAVFVRDGYVVAKELGVRGSDRPIPPGECAITSLTMGGGWVYGATSGRRAHVFAYCPYPATEVVIDMIALDQHTAIRNSLAWLDGAGLFAGTSSPGREGYAGGEVLSISQPHASDYIQEWGSPSTTVKSLGVPVAGEGIACLIADSRLGRLYGLSDRSGTLFCVEVDGAKTQLLGQVDPLERFGPTLILGPDGAVYACGTAGRLMRYDPTATIGAVEYTGLTLPSLAGRGQYFGIGAWALDARGGLIYAGDQADGMLMAIDVRQPPLGPQSVRVLGKPTAQPHVRALAVATDGRVYGVAGRRDGIAHLFLHDPRRGELRDLGVLVAGTEKRWYGYEFDAMLAAPDGRIYLGESDRVSHLFMYFPAMG